MVGPDCTLDAGRQSTLLPLSTFENFPVEESMPEFPFRALNVTVLPRIALLDEKRFEQS